MGVGLGGIQGWGMELVDVKGVYPEIGRKAQTHGTDPNKDAFKANSRKYLPLVLSKIFRLTQ